MAIAVPSILSMLTRQRKQAKPLNTFKPGSELNTELWQAKNQEIPRKKTKKRYRFFLS
jgi:hypothetical protein